MGSEGSVSVVVEAPPERVYELLSDITRMGEWSPETVSCRWVNEDEFEGTNKTARATWTTRCRVVESTPGRAFAFQVQTADGKGTTWRYDVEPVEGGTKLTESYSSPRRNSVFRRLRVRLVSGIADRHAHNLETMTETLNRIKAAAEQ